MIFSGIQFRCPEIGFWLVLMVLDHLVVRPIFMTGMVLPGSRLRLPLQTLQTVTCSVPPSPSTETEWRLGQVMRIVTDLFMFTIGMVLPGLKLKLLHLTPKLVIRSAIRFVSIVTKSLWDLTMMLNLHTFRTVPRIFINGMVLYGVKLKYLPRTYKSAEVSGRQFPYMEIMPLSELLIMEKAREAPRTFMNGMASHGMASRLYLPTLPTRMRLHTPSPWTVTDLSQELGQRIHNAVRHTYMTTPHAPAPLHLAPSRCTILPTAKEILP